MTEDTKELHDAINEWGTFVIAEPTDGEILDEYIKRCGIKHFSARECLTMRRAGIVVDPPPRNQWANIIPTLRVAEMLRNIMGHGLVVGNGYRPPEMNKKVGGSRRSRHLFFQALDLDLPSKHQSSGNRKRYYEAAVSLWMTLGDEYKIGIGLYSPHGGSRVHIDTGYRKRRWERKYVDPIVKALR